MSKEKFIAAVLDSEYETYVVHVGLVNSDALPSSSLLDVQPFRRPQISGLIAEETFTKVTAKYSDFADIFFSDLAFKLSKHIGINDHARLMVSNHLIGLFIA